jgi:hypothetical protein
MLYSSNGIGEAQDVRQCDQSFGQSGFLTPVSNINECRRDSIVSQTSTSYAQSFISANSAGSCSFHSPLLPSTPISSREQGHDDYVLIAGIMPHGHMSPQSSAIDIIDCLQDTPIAQQHENSSKQSLTSFQSNVEWPNMGHSQTHSHQSNHTITSTPALSTGLHPLLPGRPRINTLLPHGDAMLASYTMAALPSPVTPVSDNGFGLSFNHFHDTQSDDNWASNMACGYQYTQTPCHVRDDSLIPSDTMVQNDTANFGYLPANSQFHALGFYETYDYASDVLDQSVESQEDKVSLKRKPASRPSVGRIQRRIFSTSTGGKGLKKEQQRSRIAKRRPRAATKVRHELTTVYAQPKGASTPIAVELPTDLKRVEGSWQRTSDRRNEKFRCTYEKPNGEICTSSFCRVEHLKRHQKTHREEKSFCCVVEKCGKAFSRNDNRAAHYKCHIKQQKLGERAFYFPNKAYDIEMYDRSFRPIDICEPEPILMGCQFNEREAKGGTRTKEMFWWDDFCDTVRGVQPSDEAEKIIQTVEKNCQSQDKKAVEQVLAAQKKRLCRL